MTSQKSHELIAYPTTEHSTAPATLREVADGVGEDRICLKKTTKSHLNRIRELGVASKSAVSLDERDRPDRDPTVFDWHPLTVTKP